jgi:hypothetical protein
MYMARRHTIRRKRKNRTKRRRGGAIPLSSRLLGMIPFRDTTVIKNILSRPLDSDSTADEIAVIERLFDNDIKQNEKQKTKNKDHDQIMEELVIIEQELNELTFVKRDKIKDLREMIKKLFLIEERRNELIDHPNFKI